MYKCVPQYAVFYLVYTTSAINALYQKLSKSSMGKRLDQYSNEVRIVLITTPLRNMTYIAPGGIEDPLYCLLLTGCYIPKPHEHKTLSKYMMNAS